MITPNSSCSSCRYRECSTTVWPCRVCIRIHKYDDYYVPEEKAEDAPKWGAEDNNGGQIVRATKKGENQ